MTAAAASHAGNPAEKVTRTLRDFGRRRRTPITVVASVGTAGALVLLLAGRRDEFTTALAHAQPWVLAAAAALQVVALVARSEAWHITIQQAGGTIARRALYRASSMQVLGGVINGHLGIAVRIAALRRSSPDVCPQVPTLIAAEFPILAVEGALAALTSFTLVGPLGLPWWVPVIAIAVIGDARGRAAPPRRCVRPVSCGAVSRSCAACAAAAAWWRSCSSPSSRRSCATGCCCTPSASTPRSSTRSPS